MIFTNLIFFPKRRNISSIELIASRFRLENKWNSINGSVLKYFCMINWFPNRKGGLWCLIRDSSINLQLRFWTQDPLMQYSLKWEYTERIKRALDDAGIEIPFPHVQIFLERSSGLMELTKSLSKTWSGVSCFTGWSAGARGKLIKHWSIKSELRERNLIWRFGRINGKEICNRSQFTVIGSRLKKQKVEKNYGVLFK